MGEDDPIREFEINHSISMTYPQAFVPTRVWINASLISSVTDPGTGGAVIVIGNQLAYPVIGDVHEIIQWWRATVTIGLVTPAM